MSRSASSPPPSAAVWSMYSTRSGFRRIDSTEVATGNALRVTVNDGASLITACNFLGRIANCFDLSPKLRKRMKQLVVGHIVTLVHRNLSWIQQHRVKRLFFGYLTERAGVPGLNDRRESD